eukprot:gb/GEZN01003238.1/.p1 GENE.gb/GEZN01003238.1/~~gb/GEZN01003238.1/.p1  ORF type:complete len:495 (+),score=115.35 gb/GEZN01003238.1/:36-1520(+)
MLPLSKCQLDPWLRVLRTKVLSCVEGKTNAPVSAYFKPDPKSKQTRSWDVQLQDTVLFPEGGGQPSDTGLIGQAPCFFVYHDSEGRVVHRTRQALEVGQEVEVRVDWARRWDHMQQHTAQHLISAVALDLFGLETVSWWLSARPNDCNIEFQQKLTLEQLEALQTQVSTRIQESRPLQVHVFESQQEAAAHPHYVANPQELPLPHTISPRTPMRVVEIQGVEYNKCCGTHLASTLQLQLVLLTKVDVYKGHGRLFFLAGDRALDIAQRAVRTEQAVARQLVCQATDVVAGVSKICQENKETCRELRVLRKELVELLAEQLLRPTPSQSDQEPLLVRAAVVEARLVQLQSRLAALEAGEESAIAPAAACSPSSAAAYVSKYVLYHREEADASFAFLTLLASALHTKSSLGSELLCVLTFSLPSLSKAKNATCGLLVTGSASAVTQLAPVLAKAVGAKGGGKGSRWQGKAEEMGLKARKELQLIVENYFLKEESRP